MEKKLLKIWIVVLSCMLAMAIALPSWAGVEPLNGLDAYIQRTMREWQLPGLAVAAIKGDQLVFMKGYGTREVGKDLPVDENTVFAIGSTSKAFTATAIGLLVQDGKISWDDRVTDHLPWFQMSDPWVTHEIRVRDLLCNRSGLSGQSEYLWYATDLNREEVVRRLRYVPLEAGFRYKYAYRNTMFSTAGEIIPAVTGKSWDELVEERLFGPLGMTRSSTSVTDLKGLENVAAPHMEIDGQIVPVPYRNIDNIAPAGGINSSIKDMAQWLKLQINEGSYQGSQLVKSEIIRETHTQQTPIPSSPGTRELFPTAQRLDYCLSWLALDHNGQLMIWHNGAIDGMHAVIGLIPEMKIGAVILSNYEDQTLHEALFLWIIDSLMGKAPRDWSQIYHQFYLQTKEKQKKQEAAIDAKRVKGTHPTLPLGRYAGNYQNDVYGKIKVEVEKEHLVLKFSSMLTGDMEHWNYDTFSARWRDKVADVRSGEFLVNFDLDTDGTVKGMNMVDMFTFERVPESASD